MSNQTNVHFINKEWMLAATVGDAFPDGPDATGLPVEGRDEELLLPFLQESLKRIREEDEDLADEIEQDDLLELVQNDWNEDVVAWVTTFETSWALDDDMMVLQKHAVGPVKERLVAPEDGGDFPSSIPENSPFRAFDVIGWQFFDREEFDAIMQALRKARQDTEGTPGDGLLHDDYEEEWDTIHRAWQNGGYDLVLFWWLM